jgi:hypothetical protein
MDLIVLTTRRRNGLEVDHRVAPKTDTSKDVDGSAFVARIQINELEKSIGADRATTEGLLRSMGARKSEGVDEWTLKPREGGTVPKS